MSTIRKEDVKAIRVAGEREVCVECFGEDWSDVNLQDIITEDMLDDEELLFCDRCKEMIL